MSKWSSAFRDSRWQKKRLEIMERDDWTCVACGASEGVTLNVHHAYYESGKAPWEYEDSVFHTMCSTCHAKHHELKKRLSVYILFCMSAIGNDSPNVLEFLIGVTDSLCGPPRTDLYTDSYILGYDCGLKKTDNVEKAKRKIAVFMALIDVEFGSSGEQGGES